MNKTKKTIKVFVSFVLILSFCMLTIIGSSSLGLFADPPKIKVFIDPGHGGRDPGAIGYGYQEKIANLDIALRVKSKLEASGFAVIMRRADDSYKTLDEIVSMANSSGADIFVSIHNNASISPYAHGTETYWCPNGVAGSSQLASLIQSYVINQTGRANRGVKTANFRVIKYTTMPAALIECAFISNQTECSLLQSADFRERCATGIAGAIAKFSEGIIKPSDSGGSSSGGSTPPPDPGTGNANNYSDVSTPNSSGFSVGINFPPNNATVADLFVLRGWSADLKNSPAKELAKVEIYKGTERTEANLLGRIENFETNVLGSQGVLQGGWQLTIDCDKLDEGENILFVYAYDKDNNYSTGNVKVNVLKSGTVPENLNLNPVAKPGGPYEGDIGNDINFNGSYSFDPDGVVTEYSWDFGDGNTSIEEKPVHAYNKAGNYTVTLTVKDNGGKISAPVSTDAMVIDPSVEQADSGQDSGTVLLSSVSNSTSVIGYIDIPEEALLKVFADRNSAKLERAARIAPLYLKYGKLFNIRADIAWAQMCHETGFLTFTGDVKPEQNNFCGLGATGGGVPGHSFATEELGVIAHYAHLAWYYYPNDVNEYCTRTYDPRHFGTGHINYTGNTTIGFMNGRWAPGATYTDKIILFTNQIIQGIDSKVNIKSSVTANAGQNRECNAGDTLTFDASSSIIQVIGDTAVSYNWDWDGDGNFDQTVDTAVVKHTFQSAGTFSVVLKISLSDGVESSDSIEVRINSVPFADAGGPYTGEAGKTITLDGSGSTDADGEITEYIWDFGDGTTGSGEKPEHSYSSAGEYTVKLVVRDDSGEESLASTTAAVVKEKQYPVNSTIITNSTSFIGYHEVTADQLVKLFINRGSSKVEWARRLAPIYITYGKLFNMRADIAWAQMCHETGFLEFTGDVRPGQNNFVGLGATGGGEPGHSFATEELGVIAHYAHLAWYYYPNHINQYCNSTYDPRHFGSTHSKYTGDTSVGFLNGRWAPGATYTDKILQFANQIYGY